jgi:hypothetical protein
MFFKIWAFQNLNNPIKENIPSTDPTLMESQLASYLAEWRRKKQQSIHHKNISVSALTPSNRQIPSILDPLGHNLPKTDWFSLLTQGRLKTAQDKYLSGTTEMYIIKVQPTYIPF